METKGKLYAIPGSPPDLLKPPKGDAFAPRNEYALAIDYEKQPPTYQVSDTHFAATWLLHPQAPKINYQKKIAEQMHDEEDNKVKDNDVLLKVNNLKKYFNLPSKQVLKAVDGVNIEIKKGETFGLVGESGCEKSTTGRTIIGLYEPTEGDIIYDNQPVNERNRGAFHQKIQMIFQDPYASLNPRKKWKTL